MAKEFKNLSSLFKYIEEVGKETVKNKQGKVVEKAIDVSKQHVKDDVYNVYQPRSYVRTYELQDSWEIIELSDGSGVEIVNTRSDGGRDVAYIVHSGEGYEYDFEYAGRPRPFMERAVEELNSTGVLSDEFIKELKKKGFAVKKVVNSF